MSDGALTTTKAPTSGDAHAYISPSGQIYQFVTPLSESSKSDNASLTKMYSGAGYSYLDTPSGDMWLAPYSIGPSQKTYAQAPAIQSKYTTAPKQEAVDPLALFRSRKAGLI